MLSHNISNHGYTCVLHNINELAGYVCASARNHGRSSKRDEYERSMALDRGLNRTGLDFEMGAHREAS